MIVEGRAAWPGSTLDDDAFAAHVAARAPGADAAYLSRLHASDLFLACACARGDVPSIAAFDRTILAPLPAILGRRGATRDAADEVVQALRERLLVGKDGKAPLVGDYDGRGALAAWARVAAIRAASNARRNESNRAELGKRASPPALPVLDPALDLVRRRYGEAFRTAIGDAFAALSDEERTVLRLHFTDGLSADATARVLGISRATANRRMLAARTRVREETLRLLGERIAATPTELVSILGVVRSTLDVSLAALVQ